MKEKWKEILAVAWPLIIANAFWNLQMTIDRIYLGKFSADALAAGIAAIGIFWAPMALIQQTSSYVTTFIAQYCGAGEEKMVGPSLWQSLYVAFFGGLLFLFFIPLSGFIFDFFGHSQNLRPLESAYFDTLCWSAMPTALVASASGFFTGIEKSSVVMKINIVGVIINAILGYLLVFGNFGFPRLGISGAGIATAIANFTAAFYGLYLIFNQQFEDKYKVKSGYSFNKDLLKRFIKFGVPSGLQWALEGLAFTSFLIFVGRMPNGDAALAASGITVTIMMLSILPCLGVAQAISVLTGKYLGEKRPEKAEAVAYTGVQICATYILCIGITFLIFPEFYLNWFKNTDNQILWDQISHMVPILLIFVACFTLFDSVNLVISFALRGAGDTRFVSLLALILPWPLMVYPSYLFVNDINGVYKAWGAASVYIIFLSFIFLIRFKQGKWKSMSVIHPAN